MCVYGYLPTQQKKEPKGVDGYVCVRSVFSRRRIAARLSIKADFFLVVRSLLCFVYEKRKHFLPQRSKINIFYSEVKKKQL